MNKKSWNFFPFRRLKLLHKLLFILFRFQLIFPEPAAYVALQVESTQHHHRHHNRQQRRTYFRRFNPDPKPFVGKSWCFHMLGRSVATTHYGPGNKNVTRADEYDCKNKRVWHRIWSVKKSFKKLKMWFLLVLLLPPLTPPGTGGLTRTGYTTRIGLSQHSNEDDVPLPPDDVEKIGRKMANSVGDHFQTKRGVWALKRADVAAVVFMFGLLVLKVFVPV